MNELEKKEQAKQGPSVLLAMATRYNMASDKFLETLKGTIMKPDKQGRVPTNEEMAAFLLVAKRYELDPFCREIYAYLDKRQGIVPVVSIDGWLNLINRDPQYDGMTLEDSPHEKTMDGAKACPEWMQITIHRKDRAHPIVVREYLDEVYQPKRGDYVGPWQTHTKRMLRHKTIIQGARVAFGFSGIYDEDEAHRIAEQREIDITASSTVEMPKRLSDKKVEPESVHSADIQEEIMPELISEAQRKRLFAMAATAGKEHEEVKIYLMDKYNILSTKDIPISLYDEICTWVETVPEQPDVNLDAIIATAGTVRTLAALNKLRIYLEKFEGENRVRLMRALDEKEVLLKGKK